MVVYYASVWMGYKGHAEGATVHHISRLSKQNQPIMALCLQLFVCSVSKACEGIATVVVPSKCGPEETSLPGGPELECKSPQQVDPCKTLVLQPSTRTEGSMPELYTIQRRELLNPKT